MTNLVQCCESPKSRLRCRTIKGGSKHAVTQCISCGYYGSRGYYAVGKKEWPDGVHAVEQLPPFDELKLQMALSVIDRRGHSQMTAQSNPRVEENRLANLREDLAQRDKLRAERAPYYVSEEWFAKRQLVFKRSAGMCEGCGIAKADQVHHMSYEHFGNEFLWELEAVCVPCHERYHAPDIKHDEAVRRGELPYEGPVGPLLTRIIDNLGEDEE